jgi:hypothetical protein
VIPQRSLAALSVNRTKRTHVSPVMQVLGVTWSCASASQVRYRQSTKRANVRLRLLGGNSSALIVVVECKSDFESDLVMRHPAVFDMAACLQHLEPADLPECARGASNGILNRVFDAVLRGTGNLDDPVDVIVGHRHLSLAEWLV